MRFTFLAPFRTDLNFNSVSMAANPGALEPTLEHVFKWYANNSTPGISLQSHRKASRSGQLYYSGLAEDALPSTVKPVFELILSDEWVADCVEGKGFNSGLLPSSIERCRIEYFDNTVALLHVDVCFSGLNDAADLFDSLDQWSTEFCGFLIEHVYPAEKRIVRELVDYDRRSRRGFSLRPSEFNVFFDRKRDNGMIWPDSGKMLWVTRVCYIPENFEGVELLERWTERPDIKKQPDQIGHTKVSLSVGNSVVWGAFSPEENVAFIKSLSVASYFYVIHAVINGNLRSLFLDVANETKKDWSFERVNQIRNYVEYVQNELSDVMMGLQGLRKFFFGRFLEVWDFDFLVESVNKKKQSLGGIVDFKFQQKQNRYARIVESVLSMIGGVAILDFCINLYWFADESGASRDGVLGLVDLAARSSVDTTLYVVAGSLLVVLFLVLKKR